MYQHIIEVEEKTVGYIEWEEKNSPVLVCLHGLAGSAMYSFVPLQQQLSQHFHIIAIDQPGHGKSDPFDEESDYSFSTLAKWYKKVFTELGLKDFYLAGHSWGADVALHFTKYHADFVRGLVLQKLKSESSMLPPSINISSHCLLCCEVDSTRGPFLRCG